MAQMVEQLLQKMGLLEDPKIIEKTRELLRLLELRSTNVNATLNDYAKIVLCIDLAARYLGISFEEANALRLSGLRKAQYANNKRMLEKILDLNKLVEVNDICIKLGLNEVSKKANELLKLYKSVVENDATDIDISHPQYPAMAVYQACKNTKRKIAKPKIMSISHLRPSQWSQLEQQWDKIIASNQTENMNENIRNAEETVDGNKLLQVSSNALKRTKMPEIEDYEIWKKRMITIAKLQINEQNKSDKENTFFLKN